MRRAAAIAAALALGLPMPGLAESFYIAFGDSMTFGIGDESRPETEPGGYPVRLQSILRDLGLDATVENRGLSGETTAEGLSRIDDVLSGGGDVLLLMEGANDIHFRISIETTVQNLAQMATRATNRGIRPVHATIIPMAPFAQTDPGNQATTLLNYRIRQVALNQRRDIVDNFRVFRSQPNLFQNFYSDIAEDPVGHPNAAGYEIMARAFADVILGLDTVPPVPIEVVPADGVRDAAQDVEIRVRIADFGEGIDLATPELLLNGVPVNARISGSQSSVLLRFQPESPLIGSFELRYQASDLASPANSANLVVSRFITQGTTFLRGDLNEDGRVDGIDLVLLASRFGARQGDGRYLRAYDLNADGRIDGQDLAILANNFGKRSF